MWDNQGVKTCAGCGETKPRGAFHTDKRLKDGLVSKCRRCIAAQREAYKQANLELVRKRNREKTRRWRKANPELARQKSTEASRKLKARNPEYHRDWYQRNIETERKRAREVMRRERLEHPERERERKRRHRENNLEAVRSRERENTHRRRALKGKHSPELAAHMEQLVREPCAYCGSGENPTIDHIVPLSRGGRHEASNLAPACFSCNSSKSALLLEEWAGPPSHRKAA